MDVLLFCCIGNAFQSPLLAALYNAEAEAQGMPGRAISAGLSNRREMPPTTAFLLEAVKREFADLPSVLPALTAHRPTPLKSLPFVEVQGVSYLYDPARKPEHLAQDTKAIQTWLAPSPDTQVMRLAIKDAGYEAWEQHGRPALDSPEGEAVLTTYRREVVTLRALARMILGGTAPLLPVPKVEASPPRVAEPVVSRVTRVERVERAESPTAVALPHVPQPLPQASNLPSAQATPPFAPAPTPAAAPVSPAPVRRIVQPRLPPPPVVVEAAPPARRSPRKRAQPATPVTPSVATPIAAPPAPPVLTAPIAPAPAPAAEPPVPAVSAPRAEAPAAAARAEAPAPDPRAAEPDDERAEVLEDVRSWLRAALPVRKTSLMRYGLWQRAEKHFGSWDAAVLAAGIPVAEPLWMLPRDSELSFDILVEALPDAIVARLCSTTVAKVRARRRANGAPDPARQITRRVMATDLLGKVSDEALAAQLGISVEEVAAIREAEGIAKVSST